MYYNQMYGRRPHGQLKLVTPNSSVPFFDEVNTCSIKFDLIYQLKYI